PSRVRPRSGPSPRRQTPGPGVPSRSAGGCTAEPARPNARLSGKPVFGLAPRGREPRLVLDDLSHADRVEEDVGERRRLRALLDVEREVRVRAIPGDDLTLEEHPLVTRALDDDLIVVGRVVLFAIDLRRHFELVGR